MCPCDAGVNRKDALCRSLIQLGGQRSDRFLRRTGMELGARRNLERIEQEGGLELALLEAFAVGVNAYTDALDPRDLPLEFRLLDLAPERWTPLHTLRVLQAMNYDLSWWT
ncbi:MAG: penicillin acylase family protein, partial [Planctomycetota bacterium]